jgi:hypothetical protein
MMVLKIATNKKKTPPFFFAWRQKILSRFEKGLGLSLFFPCLGELYLNPG